MHLSQALNNVRASLSPVAGEFALPESERIFEFLLGASRSDLYLNRHEELSGELMEKIGRIVARRLTDEPLAYILGSAWFFDREIAVTPDVLIPRPDTETLIETVLKNERAGPCRFLDFGTGSGCLSAVLAGRNPCWKGVALDVSFHALKIARKNCGGGIDLLCCNRFSALRNPLKSPFGFIVGNPPYIPSATVPTLERSVRAYEPVAALDGGPDGLDFYRFLADSGTALLRPGGNLYCEIGYDQGETVKGIMTTRGWSDVRIIKDLGGRDRVIQGKKLDK